mmetsp:Transcript_50108/g.141542  ORF Transcript_50108/g.141542 Transcript_50108/m.141542 type:complete len:207 (-) Transcript_50108:278-898(-)
MHPHPPLEKVVLLTAQRVVVRAGQVAAAVVRAVDEERVVPKPGVLERDGKVVHGVVEHDEALAEPVSSRVVDAVQTRCLLGGEGAVRHVGERRVGVLVGHVQEQRHGAVVVADNICRALGEERAVVLALPVEGRVVAVLLRTHEVKHGLAADRGRVGVAHRILGIGEIAKERIEATVVRKELLVEVAQMPLAQHMGRVALLGEILR